MERESTFVSQKNCAETNSNHKRPRSLYKKTQLKPELSLDTFLLNQLDILAENSKIYRQEFFYRVPGMENDFVDFDRHSIISLENDTFQIIRPSSFLVNKPRALYRSKNSDSKFSVNSLKISENVDQPNLEICQQIVDIVDLPSLENNSSSKKAKVNSINQETQTTQKVFKNNEQQTVLFQNKTNKKNIDLSIKSKSNSSNQAIQTVEKTFKNASTETESYGSRILPNSSGKDNQERINSSLRKESNDASSIDFNNKRTLIEKKLKLYYPFKIGILFSIFLFLSSMIQIVLQLILLINKTPLNSINAGIWSGFIGLLVFFSNVLISKYISFKKKK